MGTVGDLVNVVLPEERRLFLRSRKGLKVVVLLLFLTVEK
jgi:hypothetical protein